MTKRHEIAADTAFPDLIAGAGYDPSIGEMVTLDPAAGLTTSCGVAHWRSGELVRAGDVKVGERIAKECKGARCQRFARAVLAWLMERPAKPRTFVYEMPQIYTTEKLSGDPNDLIGLACVAGGVGVGLSLLASQYDTGLTVFDFKPGEWTGGLPKTKTGDPWKSVRGQYVKRRLRSDELKLVPSSHDAIDAVGVGLFALGRFAPRCVYPR